MEQLEHCKRCLNRTVSRDQGILCGLTNQKPNFIDNCPDYKEDPVQSKRLERHKKNYNNKEVHKESAYKALAAGLPVAGIGFFLMIIPVPAFVGLIGLIMLVLGVLSIIYGIFKFTMLGKESTEETKPVDKENPNKDLEVY